MMQNSIKILTAIVLATSMTASPAFAAQPYMASYPHFGHAEATQGFFLSNFDDTDDAQLTSWIASLLSMAGVKSDGDPSGYIFQIASKVETDGSLSSDAEVWDRNVSKEMDCDTDWQGGCPTFGDLSDNDFFYHTMYWNGNKDEVTFYWEAYPNSGNAQVEWDFYNRPASDDSRNFLTGSETVSNARIKYFQTGVESASSTDGWTVFQYDGGWVQSPGGTTYAEDKNGYSTTYDENDGTNHSLITYVGTFAYPIGLDDYVATADYELKTGSSLLAGEVEWTKSTSQLSAGTHLWDP